MQQVHKIVRMVEKLSNSLEWLPSSLQNSCTYARREFDKRRKVRLKICQETVDPMRGFSNAIFLKSLFTR